jgi:hypothetical protein
MSRDNSGLDEVDDPSEYNQRRRIRAIHDARERILEQRRRALDLRAHNQISKRQYHDILREATESFILEIEQLLKRYKNNPALTLDSGIDDREPAWYLEQAPLGAMTLPPGDREIEFAGLQAVLDAPNPIVCEWKEKKEPPMGFSSHPKGETETQRRNVQISEDVLLNAVRIGMEFLSQVGLDLEVNEDQREATADYSDILDN